MSFQWKNSHHLVLDGFCFLLALLLDAVYLCALACLSALIFLIMIDCLMHECVNWGVNATALAEISAFCRSSILDDRSLKIERADLSDEGVYICRVENSVGFQEAEARLSVHSKHLCLLHTCSTMLSCCPVVKLEIWGRTSVRLPGVIRLREI